MKRFFAMTLPLVLSLSCSKSDTPTEVFLKDGLSNLDGLTCIPEGFEPDEEAECPLLEIEGNFILSCEGRDPLFIPACPAAVPTPGDGTEGVPEGEEDPAGNEGSKGDKGDKGDKGEDGKDGTAFSLYVDESGCLWMVFANGDRVKLRGPL